MKSYVAQINNYEKPAFWGLVFMVVLLSVFYIYFVSSSIVNVLIREEMQIEIGAISSEISNLEFEYITAKNNINLDKAYEMGFTSNTEKKFVTRRTLLGKSLTRNDL